jgi:hypothetical protein
MKTIGYLLLITVATFFQIKSFAQNISVNALTLNSGIVKKGETVFYDVQINNTDHEQMTGVYKIKVQVSIADSANLKIKASGHALPTGWKIIFNTGTVITFSNCKDIIAPNDARKLLIALEGKNTGGPVIISSQLSFANGVEPGIEPGILNRDKPADNFSTSTCTVIN